MITVPREFKSISKYKARALDYSSKVRERLGISRSSEIKILFLDDDTIPSKEYMKKCQLGDYDIMEGILQPKLNYGTRYSYVENMRTLACLSVCSIYQSHGHPVWVHGEGMCIRASTEQQISWAYDVISSEDLVFGHECSTARMKWGFVWEPIYTTAPWNFRDFFRSTKTLVLGECACDFTHFILAVEDQNDLLLSVGSIGLVDIALWYCLGSWGQIGP